MNIGILLPGFSANEQDWAIPIYQHLARALHQVASVRVVALRYPHTKRPYSIYGIPVYPLGAGAWARGYSRLKLWWNALRLLRQLHQQQPFHILHAMWADETGLVAAWAGRLLSVPSVVSIAGGELARLPQIAYGAQNSAFGRWIVGQALNGASAVIAACHYTEKRVALCGYKPRRLVRIPLGINEGVFHPVFASKRANHLIHVGSLVGVKDQKTLLEAIALSPKTTLDIIGEGPLQPRLETLARALGIEHRVRFLGKVHHLRLAEHYSQARLHILTSLHEGQGMVTLEAAACGLPTISTDVGFLPDYPELGLVTPTQDPVALARGITTLLADETHRAQWGKTAQALVLSRFTIGHTVHALKTLYTELISAP